VKKSKMERALDLICDETVKVCGNCSVTYEECFRNYKSPSLKDCSARCKAHFIKLAGRKQ